MKAVKQFLRIRLTKWNNFFFSTESDSRLNAFRICHGLSLLFFLTAWWKNADEWLTSEGFHIPSEIAPPLSAWILPWFGFIQFGAVFLLVIGWKPQLSALICWICLLYVTLADRTAAYSINSIFLFTLLVLTLFPSKARDRTIAIAPTRLLQIAMVTIYFSSGWHKAVFGDWLDSPHVLESLMKGIYMTDFAAWALRTLPAWTWTITQYLVLAFELSAPVLFFSKGTRLAAIIAGCMFHLAIAAFMDQLIFFSLQMMSFYLLFLVFPKDPVNSRPANGHRKVTADCTSAS